MYLISNTKIYVLKMVFAYVKQTSQRIIFRNTAVSPLNIKLHPQHLVVLEYEGGDKSPESAPETQKLRSK